MCFGHSGFAYCGSFVLPLTYISFYTIQMYTHSQQQKLSEGDSTIDGETEVGRNLA